MRRCILSSGEAGETPPPPESYIHTSAPSCTWLAHTSASAERRSSSALGRKTSPHPQAHMPKPTPSPGTPPPLWRQRRQCRQKPSAYPPPSSPEEGGGGVKRHNSPCPSPSFPPSPTLTRPIRYLTVRRARRFSSARHTTCVTGVDAPDGHLSSMTLAPDSCPSRLRRA